MIPAADKGSRLLLVALPRVGDSIEGIAGDELLRRPTLNYFS